jgi:diguanylate cyclase (GGDEF)-like protein/PAS domain S-box-containing protein
MKPFLPRLTPAARITIGLVSLMVTLLLAIDIGLKLVPDQAVIERKIRETTSERLAVQITSLIQTRAWDTLKLTVSESLARDREILSLAVRQQNGKIVVQAGDHLRYWTPPAPGKSTLTDVRVPVYAQGGHWGDLEICYTPVTPKTLGEWLRTPLVALILVIVPAGFLVFYLYIRRMLQYLDPTAAIPDRVRAAFDVLAEGVAVIDRSGRIMLFNKAFSQLHTYGSQAMVGKNLSQVPWLVGSGEIPDTPWESAMQSQANIGGRLFTITQPDQSISKVLVNAAPIHDAKGKLRGCMVTFHDVTQQHHASEQMQSALAALETSRAKIELQNEELIQLATRDPLTGCLNRRAFFAAAEPLFGKLRQEARDMSCIMADIDFFKQVNDTHGHLVGDQVIVAIARALTLHMRGGDLLCRYGGEEFCIVLPGASEEVALEVAERLRNEIQQHVGTSLRTVEGLRITSSFGVASLKSNAETLTELIELSDFALYQAKRSGRNRVSLWNDKRDQGVADIASLGTAAANHG